MFHIYLTLAYIIPNVYLFFRIRSLFISKRFRGLYTIIYLLVATLFPIADRYSHQVNKGVFLQILSAVSGYVLPFFLYLFLSMLAYELFLLLNLFIKLISPQTRKKFTYRTLVFLGIILLSTGVVVTGVINLNTICISKYSIEVPGKESNIVHLRIAFVADFHISQKTDLRYVKKFVRKINALKPDLMLYGGDIVEGHGEIDSSGEIQKTLKKIKTRYGAFGVLGNHEFYAGQQNGMFFRKAGIQLLRDTIVNINHSFYLAGRYDQHFGGRKELREILKTVSLNLPVIMIDHRPTELQKVSLTPTDIQFSGHTHDGQMFPINLITNNVYELSWGYRKIRNTHFFVTSGLRLWGPPVKTAGKSEIMLVEVNFKK